MLMAVMMPREPREKWSDERLDDLSKTVDDLRAEMRAGFARVDTEIRELRKEMNGRLDQMNDSINARFEGLNRNLIGGLFVVAATVIGSNAF